MLAQSFAAMLSDIGQRDRAVEIRREGATRCGDLLWREAELCRQLGFLVASDRLNNERLATDPDYLTKPRAHVAAGKRVEGEVRGMPCMSIFLVDLADDGQIINVRPVYDDPLKKCDESDWKPYFGAARYHAASPDRPDELRSNLLLGFRQTWP